MFLPPKLTTIVFHFLAVVLLFAGSTNAQQAEFNRRIAAMQEARVRAQPAPPVRVASTDIGIDYATPPTPSRTTRVARANNAIAARNFVPTNQRVASGQSSPAAAQRVAQATGQSGGYIPGHMRTAQLPDSMIIDGGSPIIGSGTPGGTSRGSSSMGGEIYQGEVTLGSCASCESCGDTGGYFEECDSCCGRGGCPPGPCWLSGLGVICFNAEYFGGAAAFKSPLFPAPGSTTGQLENDCVHGFYEGVNVGIPLCKATCGWLSGQLGVRAVQSSFNGNEFTTENRNQIFVTGGLYRRVDYGFQMGMVVDYLYEEWFSRNELVQLRGDLGWVYPSGKTFGFRFAANVQDDEAAVNNLLTTTNDNYRFYYQCNSAAGTVDGSIGWSEDNQTILGLEFDMPICQRLAMQSGFTYYLNDEGVPANGNQLGGNAGEAYNIFVGLALRPRGRSHYRSYDRPLFGVADNGSMMIRR